MTPAASAPAETAAVAGVPAAAVLEPASLAEAAEVLRGLARDGAAVCFAGGGTQLGLGRPPARLDALVRTRRLARVVEHAPADQIVRVEAGLTVAALQAHLAPHRQRLALDPPWPDRATVGGVLAAGTAGPRRTRYGTLRDLVIGVTLVRADGVVARGGGKVVKNVAGFDLPRLLCGSLGTLGLVAEVTLRLHPLPEASATIALHGLGAEEVRRVAIGALAAGLEPAATAAACAGDGDGLRLLVRFEGFGPGVEDQAARLLGLAGPRAERLGAAAEEAAWREVEEARTGGDVRVKATFAPAAITRADAALAELARALDEPARVILPTVGVAHLAGRLRAPAAAARALEAAREAVAPSGGAVVVEESPEALRTLADPWGRPPPGLAVMRRLKAELDPNGRLAPGRFVGGI